MGLTLIEYVIEEMHAECLSRDKLEDKKGDYRMSCEHIFEKYFKIMVH
jgi:hypothetical protein